MVSKTTESMSFDQFGTLSLNRANASGPQTPDLGYSLTTSI